MNTSILLSKKIFLLLLISIGVFFSAKAQSFEFKNSGTDFILFDLSIPAGQNDIAYAAGSKFTFDTEGVIIKTSDGGETWETIYPVSGTSVSFEKIEFITVDLGFVAGYGLLMKTADGGETWTDVDVDSGVYLYNNLSFFDENNGFVSAQLDDAPYFAIYLTADGGETWSAAVDVEDAGGIEMVYANKNTLFSVGADERIAQSVDGGNTWEQIYSGFIQNYFVGVFFRDRENGVVAGEDGLLMTTHDGGQTWSEFSTGYHHFFGLNYVYDQLLAAGTDLDIYISNDNGDTWSLLYGGLGDEQLYEIEFFDDGSGLICGSGGTMIKFNGVLTDTPQYQLNDNKLRTFNNSYTLRIEVENETLETIEIYTVSGRLIASFQNNSNTFNADISGYAKGIYLVKVNSNKGMSCFKMMK